MNQRDKNKYDNFLENQLYHTNLISFSNRITHLIDKGIDFQQHVTKYFNFLAAQYSANIKQAKNWQIN